MAVFGNGVSDAGGDLASGVSRVEVRGFPEWAEECLPLELLLSRASCCKLFFSTDGFGGLISTLSSEVSMLSFWDVPAASSGSKDLASSRPLSLTGRCFSELGS